MTEAFTARNFNIGRAPARITLLGDKHTRPEPAQHIIEFPGGAIEVSRTSEGLYWVHTIINRDWATDDHRGLRECLGLVEASRIGRIGRPLEPVIPIDEHALVQQIAVLVRPLRGRP